MVTVLWLLLCLTGVVTLLPTGKSSMWGGAGKVSLRSSPVLSLMWGRTGAVKTDHNTKFGSMLG